MLRNLVFANCLGLDSGKFVFWGKGLSENKLYFVGLAVFVFYLAFVALIFLLLKAM